LKKSGQACDVKLSPREVSNALGRGEEAAALDDAVSMLIVALPACVVVSLPVIVFVGVPTVVLGMVVFESASVDVASGAAVEIKGPSFSCLCLMAAGLGGGFRRSIAISPRRASRLNKGELYSLYGTSSSRAEVGVNNMMVIRSTETMTLA
jgi:hypothetical protein